MIQSFNKEYLEGKEGNWLPPDGDYLCMGAGFRMATFDNEGVDTPACIPVARIVAGSDDLLNRTFECGFFRPANFAKLGPVYHPQTKSDPKDITEFYESVEATFGSLITEENPESVGTVPMVIAVTTTYSKRRKRNYRNCAIKDYPVVEAVPEPEAPTEPAPAPTPKAKK